jgi:hypothetical protein
MQSMEYNKCKWTKIRIEFNHIHTLITSDESEKALKLIKNCTSPGEDNVNSELYKYEPEECKLRLPNFFNNIHTKIVFQKKAEMPLQSHYLRNVTEETRKITAELVFLTPATRYTLKSLT